MPCAFWNNKGGTGQTAWLFKRSAWYAERNPTKKILAVDICPQANLSELFLGGLTNNGSKNLLAITGQIAPLHHWRLLSGSIAITV
jgi:cellulose biosynthesis protein BcsQ